MLIFKLEIKFKNISLLSMRINHQRHLSFRWRQKKSSSSQQAMNTMLNLMLMKKIQPQTFQLIRIILKTRHFQHLNQIRKLNFHQRQFIPKLKMKNQKYKNCKQKCYKRRKTSQKMRSQLQQWFKKHQSLKFQLKRKNQKFWTHTKLR